MSLAQVTLGESAWRLALLCVCIAASMREVSSQTNENDGKFVTAGCALHVLSLGGVVALDIIQTCRAVILVAKPLLFIS